MTPAAPLLAAPLLAGALPPFWLIRGAVAAVWLHEGLWCKLLRGDPNQWRIVESVPHVDARLANALLLALGAVESLLAVWIVSAFAPLACAATQTLLLSGLNSGGLAFGRARIHDPAGMVVKNAAFLVLAWVAACLPA